MDFSISEEQEAIQELARQILSENTSEEGLRAFEKGDEDFDRGLWKQLAEANLLGLVLDASVDGMEMGMLELCMVLEEQGRSLAPVPLASVITQAAMPIAQFGSEAQKQAWLPGLVEGKHWVVGALHEANTDVDRPFTRATESGGAWKLDGSKTNVAVAESAKGLVVSASTEGGEGGLYLVESGAPGLKLEAQLGTNHSRLYAVTLEGVAAEKLGGADALRWTLQRARVALAAITLGVSAEALKRTASYVSDRKQFGKPIGTFQGVALRSADAYIDTECIRSVLWQAAWMLDERGDAEAEVSVAKWWACRAGQRVVHSAQHLHGGIGADLEFPIHRFFFWAKQLDLELGGATQQLVNLGQTLTERRAS